MIIRASNVPLEVDPRVGRRRAACHGRVAGIALYGIVIGVLLMAGRALGYRTDDLMVKFYDELKMKERGIRAPEARHPKTPGEHP